MGEMAEMNEMGWGGDDEYSYEGRSFAPTCRCCGEEDLYWDKVDGKWMLHKFKKVHECPKNPFKQR